MIFRVQLKQCRNSPTNSTLSKILSAFATSRASLQVLTLLTTATMRSQWPDRERHWKCIEPGIEHWENYTKERICGNRKANQSCFVLKITSNCTFCCHLQLLAVCLMCVRAFTVQFQLQWQAPCNCNYKPNLPHALYKHKQAPNVHGLVPSYLSLEARWVGALDVNTASGWKQKKLFAEEQPLKRSLSLSRCKGWKNKAAKAETKMPPAALPSHTSEDSYHSLAMKESHQRQHILGNCRHNGAARAQSHPILIPHDHPSRTCAKGLSMKGMNMKGTGQVSLECQETDNNTIFQEERHFYKGHSVHCFFWRSEVCEGIWKELWTRKCQFVFSCESNTGSVDFFFACRKSVWKGKKLAHKEDFLSLTRRKGWFPEQSLAK